MAARTRAKIDKGSLPPDTENDYDWQVRHSASCVLAPPGRLRRVGVDYAGPEYASCGRRTRHTHGNAYPNPVTHP